MIPTITAVTWKTLLLMVVASWVLLLSDYLSDEDDDEDEEEWHSDDSDDDDDENEDGDDDEEGQPRSHKVCCSSDLSSVEQNRSGRSASMARHATARTQTTEGTSATLVMRTRDRHSAVAHHHLV
jgi:hypothetical protein